MSISDNSGRLSTRNAASSSSTPNRSTSTRPDLASVRPLSGLDPGSGGGGDTPPPPVNDPGKTNADNPFDGSEAGGEVGRPCAYIIRYFEWDTAEDERVCPECAPLDGQWFEEGKGPVPPLHDHCRCKLVYVWYDCYQSDGTWEKGGRPY